MPEANGTLRQLWLSYHSGVMSTSFMNRWDGAVAARIVAEQRSGLIVPCDAAAIARALNKLDAAVLIAEFGRKPQGNPTRVTETLFHIWTHTLYGS